jgi:hypothetical protein
MTRIWPIVVYLMILELVQVAFVVFPIDPGTCLTSESIADFGIARVLLHLNVVSVYYSYGACMHFFGYEESTSSTNQDVEAVVLAHEC